MRRSRFSLLAFALAGWIVAAPPAASAVNAVLCRHRAMHERMSHGSPSGAPCWCADMAGNGALLAQAPLLAAEPAALPAPFAPPPAIALPIEGSLPASPSYAPTPPPPNRRAA